MDMIRTTRTAVEKMDSEAKALRKGTQRPLATCRNEVAGRHGYKHWQHVQQSLQATRAGSSSSTEEELPSDTTLLSGTA